MIEARFQGHLGAFRLNATFTAPSHGITGLFGPSGCGKTTLLRCLAGLTRMPGSLRVGGEVWQDARTFAPPHRRGAAYVFQDADLFAHLSVHGNLMYGLKRARNTSPRGRGRGPHREAEWEGEGLRSLRTTSQHRNPSPSQASLGPLPLPMGEVFHTGFDEVVDLLSLAPLLPRATQRLSGGERQRVAIGRALLSQPRLLLLDEPLAGLDAMAKAEILPYLERLHAAVRIPMIYVSHDLTEIARLADHLIVMKGGAVVASGPCKAGAPIGTTDAAETAAQLATLTPDITTGLALAALLAGLAPVNLK